MFLNQTCFLWFQCRPQLCSHSALCRNPNHTIFWLRLPESNETSIFSLSSTDKMELLCGCSGLSHGCDRPLWMLSLSNGCHLFSNRSFSLLAPSESCNCQTRPKRVHLKATSPRAHLCPCPGPYQGLCTPEVQVKWLMQPNMVLFWSQHDWAMSCFEMYSLVLYLPALVVQLLCPGPVGG